MPMPRFIARSCAILLGFAAAAMADTVVLKNGDKVITTSGIYGVVTGVKDTTLILKIADQVKIEVAKSAIAEKLEGAQGS